jgi:iron complex transport system ATP-binding protein
MSWLEAEGLRVRLGDRTVLDNVSLSVAKGELVGLLGPNASGKSTLLRTLAGLETSEAGAVRIDGATVASYAPRDRARRIAYLEQGAASEWPIAVARLVALGRTPHLEPWERAGETDRDAIADAMARCDVTHLASRAATELSGGEAARVMLARALATGAGCLLADEPVSYLDPYHQFSIMGVIRAHADRGGLALAALHDLTLAARFCDRVLLLRNGKIAAAGPPGEILTPEILARVFSVEASLVEQDGLLQVVQRGIVGGSHEEETP